jgi:hypothetical protein
MHSGIPASGAVLDPRTTGITAPQLCRPPALGPTTCRDIHPLAVLLDPRPPGSPSPSTLDPSLEPVPQLSRIPALHPPNYPSGPAEPQATRGMTGHLPLGLPPIRSCSAPALCGMTGAPPNWDRHQPGVRQLHPPVHQEPCPSGRASPSSTVFPHNHSTRLPLRPPLEGSKHA